MRRRLLLACTALVLAACDQSPIEWAAPSTLPAPQSQSPSRLAVTGAGHAQWVADTVRSVAPPTAVGLCGRSLRYAQGQQRLFAVWWGVRPDSSAILYSAASSDGGRTWGTPVAVDTSDVASAGCSRPAPAATTVGDDLHVVYSMVASEGTGVFFAHFMSSMVHSPVPVIYGDHLVATAIAADGDRVAVAYEDPNGKRQQVQVAFSPSQGHIFQWHSTATRDIDVGTSPAIALQGAELAVAWTAQKFDAGAGGMVVRVGRMK